MAWQYDGDCSTPLRSHEFTPEFSNTSDTIRTPGSGHAAGRAMLEGKIAHVPDVQADPEYTWHRGRSWRASIAVVPMLREGRRSATCLVRLGGSPFTEQQMQLLTTFADQAVIAIENVRLFNEIQEKSRQLAEASQHKSQFLASMSHELRTPLNAILGYTELIADGIYGAPPEKMQAVLKRVESNGSHLLGLINAVLDLSKIEAGQLTLDLADYSLQNVAQTVYNAVEPLAVDKKLTFQGRRPSDLPPGHGDERRLTQVLLNLVGNAIKFTDAGEVVIKAGANERRTSTVGARHRAGHFRRRPGQAVPGISAGRQSKHPKEGGHRTWSRHLKAHRRDARRADLDGVAARPRFDLFCHAPRPRVRASEGTRLCIFADLCRLLAHRRHKAMSHIWSLSGE